MLSAPTSTSHTTIRRQSSAGGFTLIELLTVIAVIAILAGISINVVGGVQQRSLISRAKVELQSISNALNEYKAQYGDYIHTDKPSELFDALMGKRGPKGNVLSTGGKVSLRDIAGLNLSNPQQIDTVGQNTLRDPWGKDYFYIYKPAGASSATWKNPSYVLFSGGPDGAYVTGTVNSSTGFIDPAKENEPLNADNLYANKQN